MEEARRTHRTAGIYHSLEFIRCRQSTRARYGPRPSRTRLLYAIRYPAVRAHLKTQSAAPAGGTPGVRRRATGPILLHKRRAKQRALDAQVASTRRWLVDGTAMAAFELMQHSCSHRRWLDVCCISSKAAINKQATSQRRVDECCCRAECRCHRRHQPSIACSGCRRLRRVPRLAGSCPALFSLQRRTGRSPWDRPPVAQ
jgi:hypothetical protein